MIKKSKVQLEKDLFVGKIQFLAGWWPKAATGLLSLNFLHRAAHIMGSLRKKDIEILYINHQLPALYPCSILGGKSKSQAPTYMRIYQGAVCLGVPLQSVYYKHREFFSCHPC